MAVRVSRGQGWGACVSNICLFSSRYHSYLYPGFGVSTKDGFNGRALTIGPHDAVLRQHRAWMSPRQAVDVPESSKQLVAPVFRIINEQKMGA